MDAILWEAACAVQAVTGDDVADWVFADLVRAEVERRTLEALDPEAEVFAYVVIDGRRLYADGSWCEDYAPGGTGPVLEPEVP